MPAVPAAAAGAGIAAIVAALATMAWIALANRWRVQDEPGFRRMHSQPTPRGGGAGLALGWWVGIFLACAWAAPDVVSPLPWLLLVTGGYLACGLVDDFSTLSALGKFALQVALAVAVFTPLLPADLRGNFLALAALLLGLLYFVNAWNFMDGSNGMIAIQTLLIALAVGTWPGQDAGLALAGLALAGACLGFLPLNFPTARVFLGDAGSLMLGSAVYLLLLASCAVGTMNLAQALLLASVVLLDTGLTLARRILRGKPFWRAHREHLYQYAIRRGHSHPKVALFYGGGTVLAWFLAHSIQGVRSTIVIIAAPTLAWVCALALYMSLRRRWLERGRGDMGVQR